MDACETGETFVLTLTSGTYRGEEQKALYERLGFRFEGPTEVQVADAKRYGTSSYLVPRDRRCSYIRYAGSPPPVPLPRIHIPDVAALLALIEEVGEVVIRQRTEDEEGEEAFLIEIYNERRE